MGCSFKLFDQCVFGHWLLIMMWTLAVSPQTQWPQGALLFACCVSLPLINSASRSNGKGRSEKQWPAISIGLPVLSRRSWTGRSTEKFDNAGWFPWIDVCLDLFEKKRAILSDIVSGVWFYGGYGADPSWSDIWLQGYDSHGNTVEKGPEGANFAEGRWISGWLRPRKNGALVWKNTVATLEWVEFQIYIRFKRISNPFINLLSYVQIVPSTASPIQLTSS